MDSKLPLAKLLRREVVVTLLLVGVATTALGAVTWANFSDSDASDGNTIEAGTLDVTFDGNDQASGSFAMSGAKPGDGVTHTFDLKNVGSVSADRVDITLSYSEYQSEGPEPSDPDLYEELGPDATARHVEVTKLEYQNDTGAVIEDALAGVSDDNNNGIKDLADVRNQSSAIGNLAPPQSGGTNTTKFVISVQIADDSTAAFNGPDEAVMGDGIDVKVTFRLEQ